MFTGHHKDVKVIHFNISNVIAWPVNVRRYGENLWSAL